MTTHKPGSHRICGTLPTLNLTAHHGINTIFLLVFLLSPAIPFVTAQTAGSSGSDQYPEFAKFSPSMAIIIVILIAALFFMGFFSVYIRHCSDSSGGSVRATLSLRSRRPAAAARGLDPAVIETFPTFVYSVVKGLKIGKGALECAVCLNEFEDDETLRLIPKCDHVFHPECIDAWLESHVTCPVCRSNLVPQPGESVHYPTESQLTELDREHQTTSSVNGDVVIRIGDEQEEEAPVALNRVSSLIQNRPPRSGSVRGRLFRKFRSHSTGHSVVQPGENTDRFTLRLPEEVRKEVMNRAILKRATSCAVDVLPREGSSRRGYRTGEESSSNRGRRDYRRMEPLEPVVVKSDRWVFSKAPSFFSRALSLKSPKMTRDNVEGSTSSSRTPKGAMKLPSFKCLEPQGDETSLVSADSAKPPA